MTSAALTERGLVGDRAYAVVEAATGNVASAKNPRKWQQLWNSHAAYVEPPQAGKALPPVAITFSDGTMLRSDQPDIDQRLSAAFGREVVLTTLAPTTPQRETLAVTTTHRSNGQRCVSIHSRWALLARSSISPRSIS